MAYLISIFVSLFALMLGVMGAWQWRNGYRVAGGLSLIVALGLVVFTIWLVTGL